MKKYNKKRMLFSFSSIGIMTLASFAIPTILTSCAQNSNSSNDNLNSDENEKKQLQSLTKNIYTSTDGNFLFKSTDNSNLTNWTKNEVQSIFGYGTETSDTTNNTTKLTIQLNQHNKNTINVLKGKFTSSFNLVNSQNNSNNQMLDFIDLNFDEIVSSQGAIVKILFAFDTTKNTCLYVKLGIFLKSGYSWSNNQIQSKPVSGDWNEEFKNFAPETLNNGNASGYIFWAESKIGNEVPKNVVESILPNKLESTDGNYLLRSFNNSQLKTLSKQDIINTFGEGNDVPPTSYSIKLTQDKKEKLLTLNNKITQNFELFEIFFSRHISRLPLNYSYSSLNLSGLIKSDKSVITLNLNFDSNIYVTQFQIEIYLEKDWFWSNGEVQKELGPNNPGNTAFGVFPSEAKGPDKASCFIILATSD